MSSSLEESLCDLDVVDLHGGVEETIRPDLETLDEVNVLDVGNAVAKGLDSERAPEEHLCLGEECAAWLLLSRAGDCFEMMRVAFLLKIRDVFAGRKAVTNENALVRVAEHIHDDVAAAGLVYEVEGELGVGKNPKPCPGPPTHQLVSSACTTGLLRISAAGSS
jgi:hypothetical protein